MTNPSRNRTIGGLMIGILTFAVASAGWIFQGRSRAYATLAEYHLGEMAAMESVSKSDGHQADVWEHKVPFEPLFAFYMPVSDTRPLRLSQAENARRADYHAVLCEKYRRASARPWLSVEPDPPSP